MRVRVTVGIIHYVSLSTVNLENSGFCGLREEELRLDDGLSPFNLPLL